MRLHEIPGVFLDKAPIMAFSQRPRCCYGALVAFNHVPTQFFFCDSMRSQDAFAALSGCLHCVHCAVTA